MKRRAFLKAFIAGVIGTAFKIEISAGEGIYDEHIKDYLFKMKEFYKPH